MNQRNYPEEIEEISNDLDQITRRRDEAREQMGTVTDEITRRVLTESDPDTGKPLHTNDKARELAIRERQRTNGVYQGWAAIEREAEIERARVSARLERLRGEFAELKITRRERIAAIEAAIN